MKKKFKRQELQNLKFNELKTLVPKEAHAYLNSIRDELEALDEKYQRLEKISETTGDDKQGLGNIFEKILNAYAIKEKLDDYVVGQHEAKKALSQVSFYHMSHLKREIESGISNEDYTKASILLIGPTGSGKTLLANTLSRILQVPFVKVDATSMTKTGYVGDSIQDAVRELYYVSDNNLTKAECGIVLVDEVDKLAGGSANSYASNSVVTGKGVQQELLRPMENSRIDLFSHTNMNSLRELMQGGKIEDKKISTRNILFLLAGAFDGLEQVILKRLKKQHGGGIGFGDKKNLTEANVSLDMLEPQDLIEYGLIPELVGRCTYVMPLEKLTAEKLYQVLRYAEGSISKQLEESIEKTTGKKVRFNDEALKLIAEEAGKQMTGGRALTEICYRIMNELMFHLPSLEIQTLEITPEFVKNYLAKTYALIVEPHVQQKMKKYPFLSKVTWDQPAYHYLEEQLVKKNVISIHQYVDDFMSAWNPILQRALDQNGLVVISREVLEFHDDNSDESREKVFSLIMGN